MLDAATFAGSAFFLLRMHVQETKPEPPEHHFLREVTAGIEHVWRTLPLRQIVIGSDRSSARHRLRRDAHLQRHRAPRQAPVLLRRHGRAAGSRLDRGRNHGRCARPAPRRRAHRRDRAGALRARRLLLAVSSLPIVLVGFFLAGVGIVWAIVAFSTALQTRTPLAIQGRVPRPPMCRSPLHRRRRSPRAPRSPPSSTTGSCSSR